MSEKILVIGTGMADIKAARTLHDGCCDVTILEARERLGGRTHPDSSLGSTIDLRAAWEAIVKAQQLAADMGQQNVEPAHALKGIALVDEGVLHYLLQKNGVNYNLLNNKLDDILASYPKVHGEDKQYISSDLNSAFTRARKFAKDINDDFTSLEILLLRILTGKGQTAKLLKRLGLEEAGLKLPSQVFERGGASMSKEQRINIKH